MYCNTPRNVYLPEHYNVVIYIQYYTHREEILSYITDLSFQFEQHNITGRHVVFEPFL